MTTPITPHRISTSFAIPNSQIPLDSSFEALSFSDKLKKLGLIDDQFNLLFKPSDIPSPSVESENRFHELMNSEVYFCREDGEVIVSITHSKYISGLKSVLLEKGIHIQTYLRGGYAAYVADLSYYLEFLIREFLISKDLPKDLLDKDIEAFKRLKEKAPDDVDLFLYVVNNSVSLIDLRKHYMESLKNVTQNGAHKDIRFRNLLIPEKPTDLFPYPANYVLVTVGKPKEDRQTDLIMGRLHDLYLFPRDDIRFEIINGQICIPESAGNFWQMLIHRKFKVVRLEPRHQLDFRAGLAAIQLVQDHHILIEDDCTLQSILDYARKIDDERIFTGATDRAELHCENSKGFLLSVLAAYSNTANIPEKYLQILTKAIGEFPPLPSLYKYALLLTIYKSETNSAEWDPSGFLILNWNNNRIVFPKNFSLTSAEVPFFATEISSWTKCSLPSANIPPTILEGELSPLERVLFEFALLKPLTPLSFPLMEALVSYLLIISDEELKDITPLLYPWFSVKASRIEWTKALFGYSYTHGLTLWNAFKGHMTKNDMWQSFEEVILLLADKNPDKAYDLLERESPGEILKLKLLKAIAKSKYSYRILDGKLSSFEQVLFEFELQNPSKPLSESFKEILVNYLSTSDLKQEALADLLSPWFLVKNKGWIKALLDYSFKNGLMLWNKCRTKVSLKELILYIVEKRPNQAFAILDEEKPSNELRIELIQIIISQPSLSPQTHARGIDELLAWVEHQASINPNEASKLFQKHNNAFKKAPETYIKYIRQFLLEQLAKEWIESFPTVKRAAKALKFFTGYAPKERTLLTVICSLPGLNERQLIETLYLNGNFGISCEMIPFFKDRRWVKTQYKLESELKTNEWGNALIGQGTLTETELTAVNSILSRTVLKSTPMFILKHYLESIYNEKLGSEDSVREYYHKMVSQFHKSIQEDREDCFQHICLFFELIDLGVAAKLHSTNVFILLIEIFRFVPISFYERKIIDPVFNLLQTMSLVDYGSEELHIEWHKTKYQTYRKWIESSIEGSNLRIKDLEGTRPMILLCYSTLQELLKCAHLLKLTTEQYIENEMTLEEFHSEIRERFNSMHSLTMNQELLPHEDPCLICIHDLSFFLKNTEKRTRAYEAFYYLLNQRKSMKGSHSTALDLQSKYLNMRQKVENYIIAKNKGIYIHVLNYMRHYFQTISQNSLLQDLPLHNPILDALELDSIHPLNKFELLLLWINRLEEQKSEAYTYHLTRATHLLEFEKSKLKEEDSFKFLKERVERLKTTKNASSTDKEAEAILIYRTACLYLPKKKADKILKMIEKTSNTKLPVKFLKINKPPNLPIKTYLESLGYENLTDENVSNSYLSLINDFVNITDKEDLPYYPFMTVLKLVKLGLISGFPPSDCLTFMGMIASKASEFILTVKNEVVHDPYMNLLRSIALIDIGPHQKFKEDTLKAWIEKLELSNESSLVSYAKELKTFKFLPYDKLLFIRGFTEKFKMPLSHFINQEVTGDEFKDGIAVLISSLAKILPLNEITPYNDPCYNAISELSFILDDKNLRMRAYSAFTHACVEWSKIKHQQLPHIKDLQNYLLFRRSTEDIILDCIDRLNKNEIFYYEFSLTLTNHLVGLYGSYIPNNVHILDPVLHALELIESRVHKIELLKLWIVLLRSPSTQTSLYQAEVVSHYVTFEVKKIKKEVNEFTGDSFQKLRMAQNSEGFENEKEMFLNLASQYLSPEDSQSLRDNILTMLKVTNTVNK